MAGSIPWAAGVIQQAKYLGCTPWELLQQPAGWATTAAALMAAEEEIRDEDDKNRK